MTPERDSRIWEGASVLLSAYTLEAGVKQYLTEAITPPEGSQHIFSVYMGNFVPPAFLHLRRKAVPYDGHDICLVGLEEEASSKPALIGS